MLRRTGFAATLVTGLALLAGGLQGVVRMDQPLAVAGSAQPGPPAVASTHARTLEVKRSSHHRAARHGDRRRGDCPERRI